MILGFKRIQKGWYQCHRGRPIHVYECGYKEWGYRIGKGENKHISGGFASKKQVIAHLEKHLDGYLNRYLKG